MTDGSHADPDEVRLRLTAQPSNSRIARLTVTALASRMAFSYDEIEDLRIAVGEVCGLLFDPGPAPAPDPGGASTDAPMAGTDPAWSVEILCSVGDDLLQVRTSRTPGDPRPELSDLTVQILEAVVDEVDVDLRPDAAWIAFTKRRRG